MAVEWDETVGNFKGIEYNLETATPTGNEYWWNSTTQQWDLI
jgi:hypothetical protein